MSHLDEGAILALRDAAEVDGVTMAAAGTRDDPSADARAGATAATAHLVACTDCRQASEEALARSAVIEELLSALDEPLDVDAARSALRRRLQIGPAIGVSASRRQGLLPGIARRHIGKAASLLLLTAAAASALPWSPVARWWERPDEGAVPVAAPAAAPGPLVAGQDGSITIGLSDSRIEVAVRGVRAGSTLEVVWVEGASGRVSAPAGSRFSYGTGRAEVDVTAAGSIRVELPRTASFASLYVDGVAYLQGSPDALDVPGPVTERSEERIRFLVPAP